MSPPENPYPFREGDTDPAVTPPYISTGYSGWVVALAAIITGLAFAIGSQLLAEDSSPEPLPAPPSAAEIAPDSIDPEQLSPLTLETLKGEPGPQGERGPRGVAGPAGAGLEGVLVVERRVRAANSTAAQISVSCSEGQLVGGGAEIISDGEPNVALVANGPDARAKSWVARARYSGDGDRAEAAWQLQVRGVCALSDEAADEKGAGKTAADQPKD